MNIGASVSMLAITFVNVMRNSSRSMGTSLLEVDALACFT
jgi:hypothetical protein